jgi:hypothetical protein
MSTSHISQTIPLLTEPLVRAGIYPSAEQALKQIVLDYVDRRIAWAQAKARRFEKRHGQSFSDYSRSLAGRASEADEDEWMEWESLLDMLESWRQVKTEIQHSDVG